MLRVIQIAATLVSALASALLAQDAMAERGTFETVNSFATNYTTFEHAGQTIIGGPLHGTQTIVDSTGGLVAKGDIASLDCMVFAKKSPAGMDLEAPCTIIDPSGDKTFIVYRRKVGDVSAGGGGQGTIDLVGGTGKYSGLTGSCRYKVDYLPGNRGVTTQTCQWQKP